jgi:single-strand DNA-binding protein
MKKIFENSFSVTGFVAADASIKQFTTASVARLVCLSAVWRRSVKKQRESLLFLSMECWRKNQSASFELLKKGQLLTVRGYVRPEEWTDKDGVKHNRIVMVANEVLEPETKEETSEEQKASDKKA